MKLLGLGQVLSLVHGWLSWHVTHNTSVHFILLLLLHFYFTSTSLLLHFYFTSTSTLLYYTKLCQQTLENWQFAPASLTPGEI
ncbi:hypothetical protein HYPBUDRAFT_188560 [Hyphopichia burtonii NRRL Y-1933]|uniref:Uncharacterized protein n=1 Tax=Hyphopichia burtonii NRRL Y-1933 TaxID=984485 RepID=A0A1E4RME6_9ASCO|nr:hypothetical protein HYPBUDRAFT_188560 [Hyphopichia burtonii NRRL Y-1933]ODV68458.1 hypothetical protein HYPBUDRAFT_188560 [Hyphopichia burtonii NRRL Y-1933]